MTGSEITVLGAISVAGPTFAIGLCMGWSLALFLLSGSSGSSNGKDEDEG
jgi:hypothetical protein